MKNWETYTFVVNGFETEAIYNKTTIEEVFFPLLKNVTELQKKKGERLIVFVAAPPAVGKTTLCQFLEHLSEREEFTTIQSVGLDGFHYTTEYINSHKANVLGKIVDMKTVKGCPETYDTVKLKEKLHKVKNENIKWPIYDRNIHDVVEEVIEIREKIIFIEGNWLLLEEEPWKNIRQVAGYTIMILAEPSMLKERLISRKQKGGLTRKEAEEWYENSDRPNIDRVLNTSCKGDLMLKVEEDHDYSAII